MSACDLGAALNPLRKEPNVIAYLDPGAGSSIAAVLASGAVGVGVAWKVARQRVATKLRRPADVPAADDGTRTA